MLKAGIRIRMQDQPFKILAALLEKPGALVTREELRQRVWGDDDFGDFDHAIDLAIAKLRSTLGDSASSPRFIETLPKRGYRFIAPATSDPAPGSVNAPVRPWLLRRARGPVLLLVSVGLLAWAWSWLLSRKSPPVLVDATLLTHVRGTINSTEGDSDTALVTDGSRLYFSLMIDSRLVLEQLPVNGGDPITIPTPFENTALFDISPDGSELLVGAADEAGVALKDLWTVPSTGGAPRRVGNLRANAAAWSPHEDLIAYAQVNAISVCDLAGGNTRKLATLPASSLIYRPRWSPDGKMLRFSADDYRTQAMSLWEVQSDGTGLHRVLPHWGMRPHRFGSWTADGSYFVFDDDQNLWALREGGWLGRKPGEEMKLTNGPIRFFSAVPNRSGPWLYALGERELGELVRVAPNRTQPFLEGLSAQDLDFSRDGAWLIYVSYPDGALWRCRPDGTDRRRLTAPPLRASLPRWSPDGKWIAFSGQEYGNPVSIYLISSDGSSRETIPSSDPDKWQIAPSWSPDASSILFVSGAESRKLEIFHRSTGKTSTLSETKTFQPLWSPDGRHIVATREGHGIQLYDFKADAWTDLPVKGANSWQWARDGSYLYFDFRGHKDPTIKRMRLADRRLEDVVHLGGIARAPGIFDIWFGLDQSDTPLVLRDLSSQQIYALRWPDR
jgi:Tol biopolymer transport system component